MGFFSKFEGRMEDTFEGAADKMAGAPISPVQIAKKAEKMMRREKMVGAGKQYAPTLYTVLVNADDDERLFGYYPTLAGETETYLSAKAAENGLAMDGQPLVRFIVDDGLKRGKFDVVAEAVAAPIIAQLRQEEMQRYGLAGAQPAANAAGRRGNVAAGQAGPGMGAPGARQGASHAQTAYGQNPAADDYGYDDYDDGYGFQDHSGAQQPLPYVPEDEIDYSIDYGEYTFNSEEFQDYHDNSRVDSQPLGAEPPVRGGGRVHVGHASQSMDSAADGFGGYDVPQQAAGVPMQGVPNTVVFAAGSGNAAPTPRQGIVRARLTDTTANRSYDVATARLVIGRDRSSDIALDDINASRTHAELRFEPQGVWVISDLGSTNGTYVNGRKAESQPLYDGDRITIGMTNFIFSLA